MLERLILQLPPQLGALKTQFQDRAVEERAAGTCVPDAQAALWRSAFVPSGVKCWEELAESGEAA